MCSIVTSFWISIVVDDHRRVQLAARYTDQPFFDVELYRRERVISVVQAQAQLVVEVEAPGVECSLASYLNPRIFIEVLIAYREAVAATCGYINDLCANSVEVVYFCHFEEVLLYSMSKSAEVALSTGKYAAFLAQSHRKSVSTAGFDSRVGLRKAFNLHVRNLARLRWKHVVMHAQLAPLRIACAPKTAKAIQRNRMVSSTRHFDYAPFDVILVMDLNMLRIEKVS